MMSETLIDRVIAARQDVVSQLPHGASLSDAQQAEILIAQVKAIIEIPPVELDVPPVESEPEASV